MFRETLLESAVVEVQEDLLDDIVPCVTYDEEKGTFSKEHIQRSEG